MSDPPSTVDPSPAPAAPTGSRPKVTNRGRTAFAIANSNSDSMEVPEFEPFIAPGPRGFPPMTGELMSSKLDRQTYFIWAIYEKNQSLEFSFLPTFARF